MWRINQRVKCNTQNNLLAPSPLFWEKLNEKLGAKIQKTANECSQAFEYT